MKDYDLKLSIHHVIELLIALNERRNSVPPSSLSVYEACDEVRAQLESQGAFEDISAWYANR